MTRQTRSSVLGFSFSALARASVWLKKRRATQHLQDNAPSTISVLLGKTEKIPMHDINYAALSGGDPDGTRKLRALLAGDGRNEKVEMIHSHHLDSSGFLSVSVSNLGIATLRNVEILVSCRCPAQNKPCPIAPRTLGGKPVSENEFSYAIPSLPPVSEMGTNSHGFRTEFYPQGLPEPLLVTVKARADNLQPKVFLVLIRFKTTAEHGD